MMRDLILAFGDQLSRGADSAKPLDISFPRIISCGMGGSAVAGEMVSLVRDDVIIHWDYDLPVHASEHDLVVCTSWSGDTEETISSYERARSLGCHTLVITTGGKLAYLAQTNGTPLVLLPHDTSAPRAAAGLMLGALLGSLGMAAQLPKIDAAALEKEGKQLADGLGDRMLVVYASHPWRRLTGFWKMVYSETTKRQVMANWFPSGAHVEIVGWEGPYTDRAAFILLRDADESPRYAKNFDALLALFGRKGYDVRTVGLKGATALQKACNAYVTALWTALYAAQASGVDPEATAFLDEFKKLKNA